MSTHDTRCARCGSSFACPVLGCCPYCGSRHHLEPVTERPSSHMDDIDRALHGIADALEKLRACDAEEARLISEAVSNLRGVIS